MSERLSVGSHNRHGRGLIPPQEGRSPSPDMTE